MSIINEKDLAIRFLDDIDAKAEPDMVKAVASWFRQESGSTVLRNNPWNLTSFQGMVGLQKFEGAFAVFDNLTDGIKSTAIGLMDFPASDWRGYAQIVEAARSGDAQRFMQCLAQSAWDAGRYGTLTGGRNHIVNVYDSFGDYRTVSVEPGPNGPGFPEPQPNPTPEPQPNPSPSPAPSPEPSPQPDKNTYTVQPGDTLWGIADKLLGNGAFWPEIWDANKSEITNPSVIYAGQVLDIPATPTMATSPNQYTVKSGDTLSGIAEHFYHDANKWPDIYRANRTLIGGNPDLIHPGQVLTIPGV